MINKILRNILEGLVVLMLIAGLVTGALNLTLGGFQPFVWFLIAITLILLIVCNEVTRFREFFVKKK
jgi:asparagine N-glycosylation enzyme membrane subunit Stt3